MFNYAHIKNNKVIGLQSSTSAINAPELIELAVNQQVDINDDYDNVTNTFTTPVFVVPPVEKIRKITKGAFRRRLTLNEKVAIQTSTDAVVKVLDEDLKASSFVDLDFQQFIDGLNYLASVNVLTIVRVTELLADGSPSEAA